MDTCRTESESEVDPISDSFLVLLKTSIEESTANESSCRDQVAEDYSIYEWPLSFLTAL